jgi:hypothetical protein
MQRSFFEFLIDLIFHRWRVKGRLNLCGFSFLRQVRREPGGITNTATESNVISIALRGIRRIRRALFLNLETTIM